MWIIFVIMGLFMVCAIIWSAECILHIYKEYKNESEEELEEWWR